MDSICESIACNRKCYLQVRVDAETGQTILEGMGELHLDIIHGRIKSEYGVESDLGPLQIAYR